MKLKVKKLDPLAVIPKYQTSGASGMDLHSIKTTFIYPGERALIPTGIAIEIENGWEGQVRPRSSLAKNKGITVCNTPGSIDSDYRGEVGVILINLGQEPFDIKAGDRIAQLVIAPVAHACIEEVDELSETARGEGGFGSTGTGV